MFIWVNLLDIEREESKYIIIFIIMQLKAIISID